MRKTMSVMAAMLVGGVVLAAEIKSGPQVGDRIPGPFSPLNVNGDDAGQNRCLVCKNGNNPVVMVFARDCDPNLEALIQKLDKATASHKSAKLGTFVVFCSDEKGLEKKLTEMVKKDKIENTILSIDSATGPEKYDFSKDAAVTVVLYNKQKVAANYSFKKGEMKDSDIAKVVESLPSIVGEK